MISENMSNNEPTVMVNRYANLFFIFINNVHSKNDYRTICTQPFNVLYLSASFALLLNVTSA